MGSLLSDALSSVLDRRSDILVKERNDAFINGTSQSIDTGESSDETIIELKTRIQQSS